MKSKRFIWLLVFIGWNAWACSSKGSMPDVRERIQELDTTVTVSELTSLMDRIRTAGEVDPFELDKLAQQSYQSNEQGHFKEAIKDGMQLLEACPVSISAFKELAYAYNRLHDTVREAACFKLMIRAIEAARLSGDGSYSRPFRLAHSFELFSLAEASWGLKPENYPLFRKSSGELIHSCHIGRMTLLFADISHAEGFVDEDEIGVDFMEGYESMDLDDLEEVVQEE